MIYSLFLSLEACYSLQNIDLSEKIRRYERNMLYKSLTIGSVLEGVLAPVELAGGVVSFTHSTGIQSGL